MLLGHGEIVAGDADEAHQPLLPRLDGGLQRAAGAEGRFPLLRVDEVVELDEIDLIDPQALQRAADLVVGRLIRALARLGGEEEVVAVPLHPRPEPQLRIAVAGGGVDVVDAALQNQLHGAIGIVLGDVAEGRRAEDGAGALVTGSAKGCGGDHSYAPVVRSASGRRGVDSSRSTLIPSPSPLGATDRGR